MSARPPSSQARPHPPSTTSADEARTGPDGLCPQHGSRRNAARTPPALPPCDGLPDSDKRRAGAVRRRLLRGGEQAPSHHPPRGRAGAGEAGGRHGGHQRDAGAGTAGCGRIEGMSLGGTGRRTAVRYLLLRASRLSPRAATDPLKRLPRRPRRGSTPPPSRRPRRLHRRSDARRNRHRPGPGLPGRPAATRH
jgi:hypothetical protein